VIRVVLKTKYDKEKVEVDLGPKSEY